MKEAIEILIENLEMLKQVDEFSSIEKKAEHYGLMNRLEMAIDQLRLCDKYEITGGSLVNQLPDHGLHFCYKVVHENESSDPQNWEEVLFEGKQITLSAGDLVIRK